LEWISFKDQCSVARGLGSVIGKYLLSRILTVVQEVWTADREEAFAVSVTGHLGEA
jgi:hypothetical protein